MFREYENAFYVLTDSHIHEMLKLEIARKKAGEVIPANIYAYEHEILNGYFNGYIDLIADNGDGTFDIYDFKYSNNVDKYTDSPQIHIYRYFLEKSGMAIRDIGYIFVPKTMIRQKKTETVCEFRRRLQQTFEQLKARLVTVPYDIGKVAAFFENCLYIGASGEFPKNESRLCDYCEFQNLCKKDDSLMVLPKNERREAKRITNPHMWLYGDSYSGKPFLWTAFRTSSCSIQTATPTTLPRRSYGSRMK